MPGSGNRAQPKFNDGHALMVEVKDMVKTYGDLVAVDHISFSVEQGEIVGLLGPNGAGKTTTMRILTCFMPATSGRVTVCGHDVFNHSLEVRRNVGYMPENVPLYPEMRVTEYLAYRGRLKGVRGARLKKRLDTVIEQCELGGARSRIIEQLSKGNKQRVGLADALIGDPALLILDEPTIGLDPIQVRRVRELIKELGKDRTVILSTHILPEVEMMCKRVIIMNQGRIVLQESLDTMAATVKRRFTCEVKAPRDAVEKALRDIKGVANVAVEIDGEWTRADVTPYVEAGDLREAMFIAVRDKKWVLRALDVHAPTLEDVFVGSTMR